MAIGGRDRQTDRQTDGQTDGLRRRLALEATSVNKHLPPNKTVSGTI